MGTIVKRPRKNGTLAYMVKIYRKREGGEPDDLTEGEIAALDLKKRDASVARAWECWVRQYGV